MRLAICIGLGEALSHTPPSVKQPHWDSDDDDPRSTPAAGFRRHLPAVECCDWSGTSLLGIVLATGLVHVLPVSVYAHIAAIAVLMFVMRSFGAANYGVFATAVTAMVVFLIWLNGVAPLPVMGTRALNTAARRRHRPGCLLDLG